MPSRTSRSAAVARFAWPRPSPLRPPPAPGRDGRALAAGAVAGLAAGLALGALAGYAARRPAPVHCTSTLRIEPAGPGAWALRCEGGQ